MHPGWRVRSKIEIATGGDGKLVPIFLVITDQVFAPAHMAELQVDVFVPKGPEIRTGAVIPYQRILIVLDKRMQILPMGPGLRNETASWRA